MNRRASGGAAALRCGPPFSVQPGSAALGGAGLAVRLAVLVALVAGLLPATGLLALAPAALTALASLTAGATTHGASRPGRQRRGRPRGRAARRRRHRVLLALGEPQHRNRLRREVHLERGHLRPGSIRDGQRVSRAHRRRARHPHELALTVGVH